MKIRIYNVGFGDCFLIIGDTENLLIDFGSDTPDNYLHKVAENIIENSSSKELSILLTHFHNDHINGFLETNLARQKEIKDIYLPDIFEMNRHNGNRSISFLQLHILHDIFSSIVLKRRPNITLYSLLDRLTGFRANIHFVRRGSIFSHFSKQYQVLWPSFGNLYVHPRVEKAVITSLIDIGFLEGNVKDYNELIDLGIIDKFIEALLKGYRNLIQGEGNISNETMRHIEETFNDMSRTFLEYSRSLSSETVEDIKAKAMSMQRQANRISVVFQDQAVERVSSLLMTGDIPEPDLKKVIQNQFPPYGFKMSREFHIIKAPHHATSSHFTNLLPCCKYIIASNGSPRSGHSSWGRISYQYGSFYGSHKHCTMICTNARCELCGLRTRGVNVCTNCPNSNSGWTDLTL